MRVRSRVSISAMSEQPRPARPLVRGSAIPVRALSAADPRGPPPTMTCVPLADSPASTSVKFPSVAPRRSGTGCGRPFRRADRRGPACPDRSAGPAARPGVSLTRLTSFACALGIESPGDTCLNVLAELPKGGAPLGIGEPGLPARKRRARLREDVIDRGELLLGRLHPLDQPLPHLLHGAGARRKLRNRAVGGRRGRCRCGRIHRAEAQGGVGHPEHIAALVRDDLQIGRHAGQQRLVAVLDADHRRVGDDVLDRLRARRTMRTVPENERFG